MPDVMLQFGGGIGDELLLTTVAHELRRREPLMKIWQVSHSAELLHNNEDYDRIFTWADSPLRHALFLEGRRVRLAYAVERTPRVDEVPPSEHILKILCKKAGITGEIALRPYLFLTDAEKQAGRKFENQVTIQCIGPASFPTVMLNKLWSVDKFQRVVDGLRELFPAGTQIIQVGVPEDPGLKGVVDMRGKTTIRESAALVQQSRCFVGTVGLGMHLARAVDRRAVIVYGGREHSWQTGYPCNENINSDVECAPCWKWNDCDFGRKCMTMISASDVLSAAEKLLKRSDNSLECDSVSL